MSGDANAIANFIVLYFPTIKGENMPRKPRIEIAGFYHIINRGVEQREIFKETVDYEYFESLMCKYSKSLGINMHNYCLI